MKKFTKILLAASAFCLISLTGQAKDASAASYYRYLPGGGTGRRLPHYQD